MGSRRSDVSKNRLDAGAAAQEGIGAYVRRAIELVSWS